jgi:hypothetical protein
MDAAAPERHTRAALVGSGAVTTGIKHRGKRTPNRRSWRFGHAKRTAPAPKNQVL